MLAGTTKTRLPYAQIVSLLKRVSSRERTTFVARIAARLKPINQVKSIRFNRNCLEVESFGPPPNDCLNHLLNGLWGVELAVSPTREL